MAFSSLTFISVFLPIVLVLYWICPTGGKRREKKAGTGQLSDEGERSSSSGLLFRNSLLLVASLLFYAYGEPVYVFLMILTVVLNYIWARLLETLEKGRRAVVTLAVAQNLGVLIVFKYAGFLAGLWNGLGLMQVPVPQIDLPIGISFFTFQALSYVLDVYRRDAKPEHNLFRLMLYVSFFPQLIAGPIVKYHDIAEELRERSLTLDGMLQGIRRFAVGLAKKVLIANYMGQIVDTLFEVNNAQLIHLPAAWLGAFAYMLQIYFDFGGYSDMAIGLGWMFGFHFKENFRYPYIASSMKDFWRRWHISLSTWFREYLYIPLGGNRKGKVRTGINKVIVFACTGIWHGANLTFLFWGLYHGFFLLIEEWIPALWSKVTGRTKKAAGKTASAGAKTTPANAGNSGSANTSPAVSGTKQAAAQSSSAKNPLLAVLEHIYVLLAVMIGFVFFRADTLAQGLTWVKTMFTGFTFDNASMQLVMAQLTPLNLAAMAAGVIGSMPVVRRLEKYKVAQTLSWVLTPVLLILSMLCLAGGTYNAFIYFRF
ncbi:MAG: MBOAT family protein [Lachnospiraceae bacterium]|nr:MBOAT family protein [Lachnospiraceae bacterium]